MGFLDFLGKAYYKFEEKAPEIMDFMMKAQERADRRTAEVEEYKERYSNLSNKELKNIYDNKYGTKKTAAAAVLKERIHKK